MRQLRGILALSVFAPAAACTKPAGDADQGASTATSAKATTIATVNGKKIWSDLLDVLAGDDRQADGEATRAEAAHGRPADQHRARFAGSGEGRKLKDPAMRARLDLLQMQLLAGAASETFDAAHPVTEEEIKASTRHESRACRRNIARDTSSLSRRQPPNR